MSRTTHMGRFVARILCAGILRFQTVRAGIAPRPHRGASPNGPVVVRSVVPFHGTTLLPRNSAGFPFPEPAIPARRGHRAGGVVVPPLGGDTPPSPQADPSVRRASATDRIALWLWQNASPRHRRDHHVRSAILNRAARAANA